MNIKKNLSNLKDKVTDSINKKIQDMDAYNQMIEESQVFNLDNDIVIDENNLIEGNWYKYTNMCAYINIDKAKVIDGLIPINETVLYVVHINQKKDNTEYFMTLTDLRIIVSSTDKYTIYNYQDIVKFDFFNKSLMTQTINLNGIILGVDLTHEDFTVFYNLIKNDNYRNEYINYMKRYLCGINPIYQSINKIGSGISIDQNNNIVFHDRFVNNYLYKYEDLLEYEILEDGISILERKNNEQKHVIKAIKSECVKMSMRIILTNNQSFEIMILEPSAFGRAYVHTNKIYIKEYDFAKNIVDKLDSMNKDLY